MTQPNGPQNSGWQQQPPNSPQPIPGTPPYGPGGPTYAPGAPTYGPGGPAYGPGGPAYGPGGPGQPAWGPGGGPKRPKTTLYVVLGVAGVLVLVAVAALLAPGLVRGDHKSAGPTEPAPVSSSPTDPTPTPTASPAATPRLTEATTEATLFLGLLNSNRPKSAGMLACAATKQMVAGELLLIVEPPTKLAVTGPATAVKSYYPQISVPFSGTTKGGIPLSGTVDIMDVPSQNVCVRQTSVRP